MDMNSTDRLINIFIKIFIALFVILVVMPFIVDQAMHILNNGIAPKNNSIIVFKDMVRKREAISKFLEALKKTRNFM